MSNQSTKGVSATPREQASFDVWEEFKKVFCHRKNNLIWWTEDATPGMVIAFLQTHLIPRTEAVSREELILKLEKMKQECYDRGQHDLRGKCDYERLNTLNDILSLL